MDGNGNAVGGSEDFELYEGVEIVTPGAANSTKMRVGNKTYKYSTGALAALCKSLKLA